MCMFYTYWTVWIQYEETIKASLLNAALLTLELEQIYLFELKDVVLRNIH